MKNQLSRHFVKTVATLVLFTVSIAQASQPGILQNGDFNDLDPSGKPKNWICICTPVIGAEAAQCSVETTPAGNQYRIPSGCQVINSFSLPSDQGALSMSLEAKSPHLDPRELTIRSIAPTLTQEAHGNWVIPLKHQWKQVLTELFSINEAGKVNFVFIENRDNQDLLIRNVALSASSTHILPQTTGMALKAIHHNQFTIQKNTNESNGKIWVPLPNDFQKQVPLRFKFRVSPEESVKRIDFTEDAYHNLGALIEVKKDAPAGEFNIHWEAEFLVQVSQEFNPASNENSLTLNPTEWLKASPVIQSDAPIIASTVNSITHGSPNPLTKAQKLLTWISHHFDQEQVNQLDALTVFTHNATTSCTGQANVTAAMFRAAKIPTQVIANILVGQAQDMHYINQAYLGPKLKWTFIDTENGNFAHSTRLPEGYSILMRVIPQSEEFSSPPPRTIGQEWRSVDQVEEGHDYIAPVLNVRAFPSCGICQNKAEHIKQIRTSEVEMKKHFDIAKSRWVIFKKQTLLSRSWTQGNGRGGFSFEL